LPLITPLDLKQVRTASGVVEAVGEPQVVKAMLGRVAKKHGAGVKKESLRARLPGVSVSRSITKNDCIAPAQQGCEMQSFLLKRIFNADPARGGVHVGLCMMSCVSVGYVMAINGFSPCAWTCTIPFASAGTLVLANLVATRKELLVDQSDQRLIYSFYIIAALLPVVLGLADCLLDIQHKHLGVLALVAIWPAAFSSAVATKLSV